nr:uncharacterized protein LOC117278698 [Nicotiana tomentosiformis]
MELGAGGLLLIAFKGPGSPVVFRIEFGSIVLEMGLLVSVFWLPSSPSQGKTHREELCRQFEQIRQEGMLVAQYKMIFSELARHAIWLVPTERGRIRRFIDDLNYGLYFIMTRAIASRARFDESHHSRGRPWRPTQIACLVHRGASVSHGSYNACSFQSSFNASSAQSSYNASSSQVSTGSSSGYQGQELRQIRGCFECGDLSHLKRNFLRLLRRVPQQSSQAMVLAPAATPYAHPSRGGAQVARGCLIGGGRLGGSQARFYAFPTRPEVVASNTMITCIVSV